MFRREISQDEEEEEAKHTTESIQWGGLRSGLNCKAECVALKKIEILALQRKFYILAIHKKIVAPPVMLTLGGFPSQSPLTQTGCGRAHAVADAV